MGLWDTVLTTSRTVPSTVACGGHMCGRAAGNFLNLLSSSTSIVYRISEPVSEILKGAKRSLTFNIVQKHDLKSSSHYWTWAHLLHYLPRSEFRSHLQLLIDSLIIWETDLFWVLEKEIPFNKRFHPDYIALLSGNTSKAEFQKATIKNAIEKLEMISLHSLEQTPEGLCIWCRTELKLVLMDRTRLEFLNYLCSYR